MTTTLLVMLFQRMFKERSFLFKLILEVFSVFLTLTIIYYAGLSFSFTSTPELQNSMSVFTFLLIGEISLVVPMTAAERWLGNFSNLRNQQFYQTLLGLGLSPSRFIFSQVLMDLIFPLLRIVFIFIGAYFLTKINLSVMMFIYFLILQMISLVIFLFMAILASGFYLKFNRGFSFFYTFHTVSAIIGGAYFPTSIFPNFLKNLSIILPQTQILRSARLIFTNNNLPKESYIVLAVWFLVLIVTVIFLNTYLTKHLKRIARFF